MSLVESKSEVCYGFDTTPQRHIPLCVWAPAFRREVTLHDWFGASRSANALRASVSRTSVSPACHARGDTAQQFAHKSRVCATIRENRGVGSRDDGKTRGKEC